MNDQKGNMSIVLSFAIVIGLIGLGVYGLMRQSGVQVENQTVILPADTQAQPEATASTQSQTKVKSMEVTAKNGDILVMNYTGRLENGTVFDSNVDPKFGHVTPFEFKLGAGMVIKGWDEGLVGMKIGEKKTLTIPPEKGYGATGAGNAIPPNATLIFDVELVGIK